VVSEYFMQPAVPPKSGVGRYPSLLGKLGQRHLLPPRQTMLDRRTDNVFVVEQMLADESFGRRCRKQIVDNQIEFAIAQSGEHQVVVGEAYD
jgi:hypothetical protein